MSASEVIQHDLIGARPDRQRVLVDPRRQELRLVTGEVGHLLHVRLRVLMSDKHDVVREELVAAGMVRVRMRVDHHRDGLGAHLSDLVQNPLSGVRVLGIHECTPLVMMNTAVLPPALAIM